MYARPKCAFSHLSAEYWTATYTRLSLVDHGMGRPSHYILSLLKDEVINDKSEMYTQQRAIYVSFLANAMAVTHVVPAQTVTIYYSQLFICRSCIKLRVL